jgi:hypothetical protein
MSQCAPTCDTYMISLIYVDRLMSLDLIFVLLVGLLFRFCNALLCDAFTSQQLEAIELDVPVCPQ